MEVSKDYLEQLRQEDIEFFAKKYVELFSDCFGKNSIEQKENFYSEIKSILYSNVSEYIVDDTILGWSGGGEARGDKIYLSNTTYQNQAVRIHELVHSFNHIEKRVHGLRDFNRNLVLRNLDEGSTEMIAQLMVGNERLEMTSYSDDVKLANYITNIVGKDIMLQATRGNPQLLSDEVDKLLGTSNFLQYLEQVKNEHNELLDMSWGTTGPFGDTEVPKDEQLLAKLKLEVIRNRTSIDMLYDAIQKTNNMDLLQKFEDVDQKYGYDYIFFKAISKKIEVDPTKPTLASVQQEQIKREIQQINSGEYEPINELKIELLSFVYDQIDFQKYFVDKTNYEYGIYNMTEEDEKYSANFKSSLDGKSERLGGHFGINGVGYRVNEINNVMFQINNEYANKIFISDLEFDELTDKRLEIISEQLLIARQKEILKDSGIYIRNCFLSKQFTFFDVEILDEMIENLIKELDIKEQQIVEKYKNGNTVEPIENNENINIENNQEIIINKEYIEKFLNVHLDVIRGYEHQVINGQEIFMPVMKTTQELTQEQGRLFQKVEELYDNGDLDLITKRAIDTELIHQFDGLREKVESIKKDQQTTQVQQNNQNINQQDNIQVVKEKIIVTKESIEQLLKIHLDVIKGYQPQIINGQEIYMPVLKTNQELTQEQGRLFQRIEQLYEDCQLDFSIKRQMQTQLSKEFEILKSKVDEINKSNSINNQNNQPKNQNESNSQSLPISNEKVEKVDEIPEQFISAYERVYDQEVISIMREKYGYYYMSDEEKEEFDSKLYESMDESKKESSNEPEDESLIDLRRKSWQAIKNQYFSNPDLDLETIIRQQEFNEIQREQAENIEKSSNRIM